MGKNKREFSFPKGVTARVDEAVKLQNDTSVRLALPQYGFPNVLLYEVAEIVEYAGEEATKVARSKKWNNFGYSLFYRVGKGVYGEVHPVKN